MNKHILIFLLFISDALDEMVNGGYGYHTLFYPELTGLVEHLDVEKIKKALNQ
jgi:hypothetical protein